MPDYSVTCDTAFNHNAVPQAVIIVVRRRQSQSERLEYIENGLTENHHILQGHPHPPTLYGHTGYDITTSFRSEVIAKKAIEMPPPTASGAISREELKPESPNFTFLSGIRE